MRCRPLVVTSLQVSSCGSHSLRQISFGIHCIVRHPVRNTQGFWERTSFYISVRVPGTDGALLKWNVNIIMILYQVNLKTADVHGGGSRVSAE